MQQAKLNAVIDESNSYRSAIWLFRQRYSYFPGDFPYATSYWPNGNTANGDGNGNIDESNALMAEDKIIWSHLSLAGLVRGSYKAGLLGPASSAYYAFGLNAPGSVYKQNVGYAGQYYAYVYNNVAVNAMVFGSPNGGAFFSLNAGGMIPADASAIDNKIDDGNAGTGLLLASTGYNGVGCTNILAGYVSFNGNVGTVT